MKTAEKTTRIKIETTRFGRLEAAPETFLSFSDGLYGFPEARKFLLIETDNAPDFRWLQSVERPDLAFLVTDPELFYPGYAELAGREHPVLRALAADYQLLAIVTVDRATRGVSVNLAAPLAVHAGDRTGCQLILAREGLGTSHDLVKDLRGLLAAGAVA